VNAVYRVRQISRKPARTLGVLSALILCCALLAGCGAAQPSNATRGVTISIATGMQEPPASMLQKFTKQTGIKVRWIDLGWDDLQTKISTSSVAHTYFADVVNVDWSRVGSYAKLDWFHPLGSYLDTAALKKDMPQLDSFIVGGKVIGVPFDADLKVTTINQKQFRAAGVDTTPHTMAEYTAALQQVKKHDPKEHPLGIPLAAAEGLSTYWYQLTAAFGGTTFDKSFDPAFDKPTSAGYRALQWMADAYRTGLVSPANINMTDVQTAQTQMAKGSVASIFSDSPQIQSIYDSKQYSTVLNQVHYLTTPTSADPPPNLSTPDGAGIPRTAKYPKAAAEFIKWLVNPQIQAQLAGLNGTPLISLPCSLSAVQELVSHKRIAEGTRVLDMLKNTVRPVFPGGPPVWYPQFSNAAYTAIHAAVSGQLSVASAIHTIAQTARDQKASTS
jgi:multiple sugar transport system substrate-binding protein